MKKLVLFISFLLLNVTLLYSQAKIVSAYSFPPNDSVYTGLQSIRGVAYAADPFGDGTPAIAATNYYKNGTVSVFIPIGNDSLKMVWTSPVLTSGGGGSTPRYVLFGDLDNDGKVEVIYQSNANGIYIFEWDGVAGSYNFGTQPSQLISTPTLLNTTGNCEYMECSDVDGDGQNELTVAYNASTNATDAYYIISASGDWSTNDPGFSGFNVEYAGVRTNLTAWKLDGGTPYSMIAADFLGNGKKEILINNWNLDNITILNSTGPDTYSLIDSSTGKQNMQLGGTFDEIALFGGMAADVDKDGRQEVYLPTYPASDNLGNVPHTGWVHMISFDSESSVSQIDSSDVFVLDLASQLPIPKGYAIFGYGQGDIDGNGKTNLYFSSSYPYNVISAEFEGGNKKDMNNWKITDLYPGDSTIYSALVIKDSASVVDTIKTVQNAFVSKMYDNFTHLFSKNHEDMILPYQAINDSIAVTKLTWNSSSSSYDTVKSNILNPKRWSLRVLEGDATTGISVKDIKIITPDNYTLNQNYPNPFNPSTKIRFSLPVTDKITVKIFDILGNEIATLINNQSYARGQYEITWDGTNNFGQKVASGNYICQYKFGNFTKSIKMTLLK